MKELGVGYLTGVLTCLLSLLAPVFPECPSELTCLQEAISCRLGKKTERDQGQGQNKPTIDRCCTYYKKCMKEKCGEDPDGSCETKDLAALRDINANDLKKRTIRETTNAMFPWRPPYIQTMKKFPSLVNIWTDNDKNEMGIEEKDKNVSDGFPPVPPRVGSVREEILLLKKKRADAMRNDLGRNQMSDYEKDDYDKRAMWAGKRAMWSGKRASDFDDKRAIWSGKRSAPPGGEKRAIWSGKRASVDYDDSGLSGDKRAMWDGKRAIWSGKRATWDGKRALWNGKRALWNGKRAFWDGKRALWNGKRALWNGKRSRREFKRLLWEGKRAIDNESRRDAEPEVKRAYATRFQGRQLLGEGMGPLYIQRVVWEG